MAELYPLFRTGPQVQSLRYRFEKAGTLVEDEPIPFSADALLIEATVFLPPAFTGRAPGDFPLHIAGATPYLPESLTPVPRGGLRLQYRVPPPRETCLAEIHYRTRSLAQLALPVVSAAEFIRRLSLEMTSVSVVLGQATVVCQAFVGSQCQGLVASALVKSSQYSLLPIADLGMEVSLAGPRGEKRSIPVHFSTAQLTRKETLVSVILPRPRRVGEWLVSWQVGGRVLASQPLRALSKPFFLRSLKLASARFVVTREDGGVCVMPGLPGPGERVRRVGPCFLVESMTPGAAGIVKLRVVARVAGALQPPLLEERDFLISDGGNPILPGTIPIADLAEIEAFELHAPRGLLGRLPLRIPTASFDGEGGFRAGESFTWSEAAEEELRQKMGMLTGRKS